MPDHLGCSFRTLLLMYLQVPKLYVTSLETLEDEYKTTNAEYKEWFARDKAQLLDEIRRVRVNILSR